MEQTLTANLGEQACLLAVAGCADRHELDRARFGEVLSTEKQGSYTVERIELSQVTVAVDSMENVKRTASALDSTLRQLLIRE